METHLRSAVILGAFPKKRNNEISMTVRKIKIGTETERGVKKKDKNDSDELKEETNDTPIQTFSSFEAKNR